MKFPRYVFKKINGQEYHYGVGDVWLENLKYKKKDSTEEVEPEVKKVS